MAYKSFQDFWKEQNEKTKSHDVPVQADISEIIDELNEVSDEVAGLDEQLDEIEEISQPKEKSVEKDPCDECHGKGYYGDDEDDECTNCNGKGYNLVKKHTTHILENEEGDVIDTYEDETPDKVEENLAVREGMEEQELDKASDVKVGDIVQVPFHAGLKGKVKKINGDQVYIEYTATSGIVRVESFYDNEVKKGMLNGEDEYDPNKFTQKPGPSIHTTKWDDCVREARENNPKANAYAVCTAKLGEQSFKSQYQHLAYAKAEIAKARKEVIKMGIGEAGAIPNSLLAEQDLEGEEKHKSQDSESAWVNLKRMRKELHKEIGDLGGKINSSGLMTNQYKKALAEKKARLKEINGEINKVLNDFKSNI